MIPRLDDQPDILSPRAALARKRRVRSTGAAVVALDRMRIVRERGQPVLHVENSGRATVDKFALGPASHALVSALLAGAPLPALPGPMMKVLIDAGIVAPADPATDEHDLRKSAACYAEHGYAVVPDALHPYDVAALRRYVRQSVRCKRLPFGDPQVPRRYWSHDDPLLAEYLQRFTPLVAAVAGAAVRPSYVYLAAYAGGSVLQAHVDRDECQFSATIPIDYTPEPVLETPWPIRLSLPDRELAVYQSLGDALIFAGTRIAHRRDRLPDGHTSVSLLLHYVEAPDAGDTR